jgi:hypothetical protein
MDGPDAALAARRMRRIHRLAARLQYQALPPDRRLPTRLKLPARVLRDSLRQLRRHGAAAAALSGRGRLLQLLDMLRFGLIDGMRPACYHRYRLFDRGEAARRRLYVEHEEVGVLLPWVFGRQSPEDAVLISERPRFGRHRVMDEKRRFAAHCRVHGLPVAASLIELAPGDTALDAAMIPLGRDLFLKFSDIGAGFGGLLLCCTGEGDFADPEGRRWSAGDIAAEMRRRAAANGVLLQPRLVSHRLIAGISGTALSTVRPVTVRRPDGGLELLMACIRLSTGQGSIDGFTAGGLAAPIDLRTGVLGTAARRDGLEAVIRHPDTGNPIAGTALPFWREVADLALRAHASFPRLPTAGWDLAILPDGPVLTEGNSCWGVEIMQIAHRQPLGATLFPACFMAWAGLEAEG